MKKSGDYYVIVVEDTNLGQIVATATLIIEHKFIHACAKVLQYILNLYFHTAYIHRTGNIIYFFCPGRGGVWKKWL